MTRAIRTAVYLGVFLRAPVDAVLTSEQIAEATGFPATSIRRDLSVFGWCGKRGSGYRAQRLVEILTPIVAHNRRQIVAELKLIRTNYAAARLALYGPDA